MKVSKRLDVTQVKILSKYLHTLGIALEEHPGLSLNIDLHIDEKSQLVVGWEPSLVTVELIGKPVGMTDDTWLTEEPVKGLAAAASYDGPKGLEKR